MMGEGTVNDEELVEVIAVRRVRIDAVDVWEVHVKNEALDPVDSRGKRFVLVPADSGGSG